MAQIGDCWFLTGPTAAAKTAVGIELAKRLEAEIVSMDSMAVYRGMDIGTAKPTAVERATVPHHLIDIVEPSEDFSVARYVDLAERTVLDIRRHGRNVLFVGGTPLYLKALLKGLFSGPPADWALRRELEELARLEGSVRLHERLAKVDPTTAARLHPNDTRRLIRALEVFHVTGQPISGQQRQWRGSAGDAARLSHDGDPTANGPRRRRVFVLHWPREQLQARIHARVDAMFSAGLVDEVRGLAAAGVLGRTASQALGYREVLEHLRGLRGPRATVDLVKTRTRQFAKRQMTWFRGLEECWPVAVSEPLESAAAAWQIVKSASL